MLNQGLKVFQFEFSNFMKIKKNWALVIIALVFSIVLAFLPKLNSLINSITNSKDATYIGLVFDTTSVYSNSEDLQGTLGENYILIDTYDEAMEMYEVDEISSFYLFTENDIKYYTNVSNLSTNNQLANIKSSFKTYAYKDLLNKNNIPLDELEKIDDYFSTIYTVELSNTDEVVSESSTSEVSSVIKFFIGYIAIFLLFLIINLYANHIVTVIAQEKTSKTMEMLISSTSANSLIFGKFLAVFLSSLIHLIIIISFIFIGLSVGVSQISAENISKISEVSSGVGEEFYSQVLEVISTEFILLFISLFILSVAMFQLIFAAFASFVTRIEDLASSLSLGSYLLVGAFLVSIFYLTNPENVLLNFLFYFPFFTPFAMISKYTLGLASTFDIIYSIVVSLITILFLINFAGKAYRAGTLFYGSTLNTKKIIKLVFQKNN